MKRRDILGTESVTEKLPDGSFIVRTQAITGKPARCCLCGEYLADEIKQHGACCKCQELANPKRNGGHYYV